MNLFVIRLIFNEDIRKLLLPDLNLNLKFMRFFLPIILAFGFLITSCSKDKGISNEISQKEKEKLAGDSLYSLYGVEFTKPSELDISIKVDHIYMGELTMYYFLGFRKGNPWIAFYDLDNKLINEHSEVLPDSIKANKSLNRVLPHSRIQTKDAILLSGYVRDGSDGSFRIEKAAYFMYLYKIKENSFKRKIYDYGYPYQMVLYKEFREWYDGSFLAIGVDDVRTVLYNKDIEEVNRWFGPLRYIAWKDTHFFPSYVSHLRNDVFLTAMNEYFSFDRFETTLIINKSFTSAIHITPQYPELSPYSYLKERIEVELIERPSNYVRLDELEFSIEDLGNELEVIIGGTMVLSGDGNEELYIKGMRGSVLVDKKTGNVVSN